MEKGHAYPQWLPGDVGYHGFRLDAHDTLVGAFVGAHPEDPFGASAAAMLSMGIAGERAEVVN